jgi:predicted SprT family Zn-dependent metalloprotease
MDIMEFWKAGQIELAKWNLSDWNLKVNNSKRMLGCCYHSEKVICVSKYCIQNNPDHLVYNTLKHEIAHAKAGFVSGHGLSWKEWAIRVGADPVTCADDSYVTSEGDWQAYCVNCKKTLHRYRVPANVNKVCRGCHSPIIYQWKGRCPIPELRKPKWKAMCRVCNKVHLKLRKPKRVAGWICPCGKDRNMVFVYN